MSYIENKVRERIKKLREDNGYTQKEISEKLGLQCQSYFSIEKGIRGISTDFIVNLSELLMVSTDYLLKGQGQCVDEGKDKRYEGIMKLLRDKDAAQIQFAEKVLESIFLNMDGILSDKNKM